MYADTHSAAVGRNQTRVRRSHTYWLNWFPTKETKSAKGERRGSLCIETRGRCHRDIVRLRPPGVPGNVTAPRSPRRDDGLPLGCPGLVEELRQPCGSLDQTIERGVGGSRAADRPADPLSTFERHQQGADRSRDRPGGSHHERIDLHSYHRRSLSDL